MSYSSLPLTSKLFQLTFLTCALALAGCGGGDGDTVDSIAPKPDTDNNGGSDNSTTQASGIYISSEKSQLLTGKDKTTINIRVTDKNGGIVSNVPVSINVSNAAMYGLALDAPSNQITDEKGLITVDLLQGTKGIDSQLDHESLLTVTANSLDGVIKQTLPIIVSGTSANNVISSKNTVNAGENFSLSGQIVDGVGNPVANADVVLYSNDKQAGIGRLDNNGNFLFDLNSSTLEALNNNFLFSIEVKGIEINQRIPDILTVVSTDSASISFSKTPDIIVGAKQKITLNTPKAKNGDVVYISTRAC